MKIKILSIAVLFLMPLALAAVDAKAATMNNYCGVPPYVVQNVPPNIMLLVDNSGSMYNFSYACTTTQTTAAGTNTSAVPVSSVAGFTVDQSIVVGATQLWITAINTSTNTLTVGANATFSQNATVQDFGCSSGHFYDDNSGICPTSTTATCNNPGTYPTTTVSAANTSGTRTKVTVSSIANFYVGETILVGATSETIQSIAGNVITVNVNVTTSVGQVVKDSLYDTCHNYSSGANMLFSSLTGFSVGEVVVITHGGSPYTATITSISTNVLTVSPSVVISSNDRIYDYNCYNFQTPYPERSFDPTKTYYGYFDNSAFYIYSTSRFTLTRPKAGNTKASNEWDGNFLNWLTMRRADIIKKALTGGYDVGADGTGFRKIRTIEPDGSNRGIYKAVAGAEQYMDCSGWGCTANTPANFVFLTGTTNPSSFTAYSGTAFTNRGSFSVDVQVPAPVAGVLQNTVGAKARLGLTYYAGDSGGLVKVPVSGGSLNSVVSWINQIMTSTVPVTNTPLGEALYSVVGYFQQNNANVGSYTTPSANSNGPLYHSGDWTVSAAVDPFNYGTSTTPRYPPCVQNFVLVITDGEPCSDGNLPATITNISSGNTPFVCSGSTCPATTGTSPDTYSFPASTMPSCNALGNVAGLEKVAYYMHTTNLRPAIFPTKTQTLTGYFIFAFGQGSTLLKYSAINGAFDTSSGSNPSSEVKWDVNADGQPDNYAEASEGYALEASLDGALSTMLKRASSGTAASVLASGESSGASLIQAVFYPRRNFGNAIINWTGESQNFWYYKDPYLNNSTTREDTVVETPDRILDLQNDYIIQLYFDTTALQTMAKRFQDVNGDSTSLVAKSTVTLENVSSIWKAGQMLWQRNLDTTPRSLFTTLDSKNMISFSEANANTLAPYMQLTAGTLKVNDIIRFVHGYRYTSDTDSLGHTYTFDYTSSTSHAIIDRNSDGAPDYRLRTVKIGSGAGSTNIWKLGDVVNSTPKISSWIPLNKYDQRYLDASYGNFIDPVKSTLYKDRGMVFVGGNDGMLHAFKLGKLALIWTGQGTYQKAKLVDDHVNGNIGDERWAFIPKNVLPYLAYTADPDYCHLYSVDLTPLVFDASIGAPGSGDVSASSKATGLGHDCSSPGTCDWRTILIGGMRWGGACRKTGAACNSKACNVTTSTTCTTDANCPAGETCDANCVNTPITDPADATKGLGYSSYFALDVTDQSSAPTLLWEYSSDNLGFATTGPAIVRIGNSATNGKWFVVFGSGPTGPMDVNNYQFLGRSDQALNYFVLDLKSGNLLRTISTGITEAFSGTLMNAAVDTNIDYKDDAVYAGYIKKCTATTTVCTNGTWSDGGIGAIITKGDPNPANWTYRKIMDGIGPVPSAVANLQDSRNGAEWLFVGTGRYYYEQSTTVDDADNLRYLIGVKDPCFNLTTDPSGLNNACTTQVSLGSLTDVTNVANAPQQSAANLPGFPGWKLALEGTGPFTYSPDPVANFRAERVVSDTVSMLSGNVMFSTYKPYADECGVGGKTFVWALRYNTGGTPSGIAGNVLLQTSTGAITQISLAAALTAKGGREIGVPNPNPGAPNPPLNNPPVPVEGYSSEGPPSTIQLIQPAKKALHMIER